MNITRRQLLILLPAAAVAWKYVLAGTPEASPNYKMNGALVGDADRHPQVHRLRQLRARVPAGERCSRRLLPHLGRALPRRRLGDGVSQGGFARWRQERISPVARRAAARTSLFPRCAITARIRLARRCVRWVRRSSAPDGVVLVDQTYCLGCRYCVQACPYGCRFINPADRDGQQVHALLSPHHQGPDHRVLRSCPTGARQLADLKNPKDPIHEFLQHPQRAGSEAADGHALEVLLLRPGWLGAIRRRCADSG